MIWKCSTHDEFPCSIRVQALQDQFARFASDLSALKAEVISKHYEPRSIYKQANAQFIPQADQQYLWAALELMQSPQVKWRVDIRPESIAMVDYAQLKSERTEFLTAMATFLQSSQAVVQAVPGSTPFLLQLMKWGLAGFKGGEYLEGIMDQAIDHAMKAQPEDKEGDQQKAEQQKVQMEFQMEMQKIQAKAQADMQVQQTKAQGELQRAMADHGHKMEQQQAKAEGDMQKIFADLQADLKVIRTKLGADMQAEESQAVNAAAESQVGHEQTLTEMAQEHEYTMEEMGASHAVSMEQKEQDRKNSQEGFSDDG